MPEQGRSPFLQAITSAVRALSIVMGSSGLGMLGGLAYGAREASRAGSQDELLTIFGWIVSLGLCGTVGFVIGLGVGLLVMVLIWIVGLARKIVRSWGVGRVEPD